MRDDLSRPLKGGDSVVCVVCFGTKISPNSFQIQIYKNKNDCIVNKFRSNEFQSDQGEFRTLYSRFITI